MKKWSEFTPESYMSIEMPVDIFLARGMLSNGEVRALYAATRDFYTGAGEIIDAGAFAGLSAHCFAFGLNENENVNDKYNRIYSYDKFIASEEYIRQYIEAIFYSHRSKDGRLLRAEHVMGRDESFRNIFDYQNLKFSKFLKVCEGDFLDFKWGNKPIEILFADVCKTKDL